MWAMSHCSNCHQYYCMRCCCSTDSWSVTTCLSLKLHNKFRISYEFPSLFSLIYGDEATWTNMLVYSADMHMAHIACNHFTCHPGKHKCSWHAMGGWCLSSGSWDKEQKMRIAGHCDPLQAKGTVPWNSLWQALPSFHRRTAQRLSSPIFPYHGENSDLVSIRACTAKLLYCSLMIPCIDIWLALWHWNWWWIVGKMFDPHAHQVNIIAPAHLQACESEKPRWTWHISASKTSDKHQHLVPTISRMAWVSAGQS